MPYANKQKDKEFHKEYYKKNRDKILSRVKEKYQENIDAKKDYGRNYFQVHKNEIREKRLAYGKKWRQENAGLINSWTAERRSKIKNSIDKSADMEKIKQFYILAENLTKNTGESYVVDHIMPIILGGKHHQDNLQVITALDNARKGYKYPFEVKSHFNPSVDWQISVA